MADLGNAIRGLELCGYQDGMPQCDSCPYDGKDCWTRLKRDALSLLKALEARLMTLEEVRKHYTLPPVVLDDLQWQAEYLSNIAPLYFEYKQANTPSVHWRGQREAQHCLTHWAKLYGILWRCWTSRPTDAQREAVKWDE